SQSALTVRDLAKTLRSTTIRSVDEVATTLVALLADEASELGGRSVERLHADVIDPKGARVRMRTAGMAEAPRAASADTRAVACVECQAKHELPLWVFSSRRPFRFKCSSCGTDQVVRGTGRTVRVDGRGQVPTPLAGPSEEPQQLLLKQEHQNYRVQDWETVRRWVRERRVGPDDRVSESGVTWDRLRDRPELADLFRDATPAAQAPRWDDPATEIGARERTTVPWAAEGDGLGADIEKFLEACQAALDEALSRLPADVVDPEVVVLLAGRASLFQPIQEGIHASMKGRVVHLTNAWVRKVYGETGTIDPTAGLKTLTVNGGGLFALNQTNADTSHLLLSFETERVDCHTYLDTGEIRPWWLTRQLDLKPGGVVDLIGPADSVGAADASPVPLNHPLLGDVRLQIEGLPEDRAWEPWVTIARGSLRRIGGHRPRTTESTRLVTGEGTFLLTGLSSGAELEMVNLLPELELLGSER
ncbi:MAG: hypothetical protein H6736_24270, partial [Alphaproteobacteria bacterium]|nr:hypothetical protein [Alphaproteobacteria bacterium]